MNIDLVLVGCGGTGGCFFSKMVRFLSGITFADINFKFRLIDGDIVELYRIFAEQGLASAQYDLGQCYYKGQGIEQSYTKALKWFHKAAVQGNATAQCNLGYCYDKGHGVDKDETEAVKWYRKAAEQGDTMAQYKLGVCYEYGRGVTKDKNEATKWYIKAAKKDNKEEEGEFY